MFPEVLLKTSFYNLFWIDQHLVVNHLPNSLWRFGEFQFAFFESLVLFRNRYWLYKPGLCTFETLSVVGANNDILLIMNVTETCDLTSFWANDRCFQRAKLICIDVAQYRCLR